MWPTIGAPLVIESAAEAGGELFECTCCKAGTNSLIGMLEPQRRTDVNDQQIRRVLPADALQVADDLYCYHSGRNLPAQALLVFCEDTRSRILLGLL
jgi:hypothetical protein